MLLRCLLVPVLAVLAHVAQAQESVVVGPDHRALRVELPATAFSEPGAALSIDLDGYDVTSFGRLSGTALEVELETPLNPGEHSFSVLLFLPDGRALLLVDAALDVPALEGGQWSLNTTLQTSYRTDQHPQLDFQDVDETANNGSVSLAGIRTWSQWRLESAVDAIYDPAAGSGGDSWRLPAYEFAATHLWRNSSTSIGAGNVEINRNDLLFSRFKRRGAAVESVADSGWFDVQMFSVASAPRSRFDGDYLSPGDGLDRSGGVSGSVDLLEERVQVGGGLIDGKTAFGGAGFNAQDDAAIYGGDTWNLTLDTRVLDGSVWLHLERAESEFDADGLGIGLPAHQDDAGEARMRISSMGRLGEGPFAYWSADLLHKRVGRAFYSIGNLAEPGDLETDSVTLRAGLDSIAIDVETSRQRTNPEDDPWLATQTLRRSGVNLAYTPAELDITRSVWRKIGAPSLTSWIYGTDTRQPEADAMIAGFDVDNRTEEAGVALTFARERLTWGLQTAVVEYTDDSEAVYYGDFLIYEPPPDSRNVETSVQASWAPGDRVTLDAYLQRNRLEDKDFGDEYRTTNYGLNGTFFLMPKKLSLFTSVSQGRDRRDFGNAVFLAEDLRSRFASMQLDWFVKEASGGRPGISVYVRGNYARHEDLVFLLAHQISSIYVGATATWARSN